MLPNFLSRRPLFFSAVYKINSVNKVSYGTNNPEIQEGSKLMNRFGRLILLAALSLSLFTCANYKAKLVDQIVKRKLAQKKLPVDKQVRIGHLPNGLTYYIRVNKHPEKRAFLRLAVNAGSVLEDDDQQGLAHLVEHMCFNGTKHFPKQALIDYLESIGIRFGPDLNAYTSFDETVYMLEVPTDTAGALETGLQILEDWAHEALMENEEIDKERGVVIEEWRLGRGADQRMFDKQLPVLFHGSRYAERLTIGKKEIIQNAPHETVKRFYYDWYRPDLQAVVAVGDFDPDRVEQLIKEKFGSIPAPQKTRPRKLFPVPDHKETLFAIAADSEATRSRVSIYFKHPHKTEQTFADYRRGIIRSLYNSMLNNRFREIAQKPDAPFLYAYSGMMGWVRTADFYVLGAGVKEGGIVRGLEAILTEALRVQRFGFTLTELERQKKELLRRIEKQYREQNKLESNRLVSEYVRNYLRQEPIPGIEFEYKLTKMLLPTIKLEEVNALAKELITDDNRVVLANSPLKPGLKIPTEEELAAVFNKVSQEKITPYEDITDTAPLLAEDLESGEIVEEKSYPDIEVTEWRLSNGVRVIWKKTDFKNDEILFTAFSPGGTSLVPLDKLRSAQVADDIVSESGVDGFSAIVLEKKLAGKVVNVTPYLGTLTEGLRGSASPQDLETLFKLIYLYFTTPRKDEEAFQAYLHRLEGMLENRSASPEAAFSDTITVTITSHNPRRKPFTMEDLKKIRLDEALDVYRDRFADADDFTFIFVGNLDPDQLKQFVTRYLGSLPTNQRQESWADEKVQFPQGIVKREVYRGIAPKSYVYLAFNGPFEWNVQNRYDLQSTIQVLRIIMRERLREAMSGVYGVRVSASVHQYPKPEYRLTVSFGCAPERVGELTQAVFDILEHVKQNPVDDIYITKVKETQIRTREVNLKKNNFWLRTLKDYYFNNLDPTLIMKYPQLVKGFDKATVQKTVATYFNPQNYVQVVLYPENFAQK